MKRLAAAALLLLASALPAWAQINLDGFPQPLGKGSSPTFVGLTLSGLTAGSVVFAGIGGIISQDNSNFFWDATNHRLGLGTTSPQQRLHALGPEGAVASFPAIGTRDSIILENNQSAAFAVITSAAGQGNMKFYVSGGAADAARVGYNASSALLHLITYSSAPIVFYPNNTEAARINSSGLSVVAAIGLPTTNFADNATCATANQFLGASATFVYICTAANTVGRIAIAAF